MKTAKASINWLNDVLFPVAYYRLGKDISYSYSEFKKNMLLRKLIIYPFMTNKLTNKFNLCETKSTYALCYRMHTGILETWTSFSIASPVSGTSKYVSFYADASKKPYAAFAYEFSTKSSNHGTCCIQDLSLPYDAVEQMKSCILNRDCDECLALLSTTNIILHPKETFEEVLIEKDLGLKV